MTPDLSVVIVASWSADAVMKTVTRLVDQDVEVIMTSVFDRVIDKRLPIEVRWLVGQLGDGVPDLRRIGAMAATGRVVAFLEDACIPCAGWVEAIRGGFQSNGLEAGTGELPLLGGPGSTSLARG